MFVFGRRVPRHFAALLAAVVYLFMASAATAAALLPASAPHGARLVITGTELDASRITADFAAPDGSRVMARIVARHPHLVEIVVPSNATTGPVRVTQGTAQLAALPFTLLPDPSLTTVTTLAASDASHDVLKTPSAITVAPGGIFVADTGHGQVKLLSYGGAVTLVASGFKQPAGLAFDAARNIVYVADAGDHVIRRITSSGVSLLAGDGKPGDRDGAGAQASFNTPVAIALDANGTLYIADRGNHQIRRVTPEGVVTTFAGRGTPGLVDGVAMQAAFQAPEGVAVSGTGIVYVADTLNHVIRKIDNGIVTTLAGTSHPGFVNGPASAAEFKEPAGIAVEDDGALYVADRFNHAIRRVGSDGTVTTVAGTGRPGFVDGSITQAMFNEPAAVAYAGTLFIADSKNDAVRAISSPQVHVSAIDPAAGPVTGGNIVRVFGTGFVGGETQVTFGSAAATATFVASTELLVTVPAGSIGAVDVTVRTPASTDTLAGGYTYLAPPTVTSVDPRKLSSSGGELLTINGTGFTDGATVVSIGGVAATAVTVVSSSSLTCIAPPHPAGVADVVITSDGGAGTLAGAVTYFAPPAITAFSPRQGFAGTVVTISGTSFDPDAAGDRVVIGSVVAPVTAATATQLTITIPPGAQSGRFTVTTAGGSAMSAEAFVVPTYTQLSVSPATALLNAGATSPLHATAVLSTGSSEDVTARAAWTSSNPVVASVDATGVVHALAAGTATVTASFSGLTASSSITVTAAVTLPPDPATVAPSTQTGGPTSFAASMAFLYSGAMPIQTGVAPGAIDSTRIAVLRGRVTDRDGAPLAAVKVSILNAPSFGYTLTRADGQYDLATNGGAIVTVKFEKSGFISAQRQANAQWLDFVALPDVALVAYDSQVTAVTLGIATAQVAQSSTSTDADGTRHAAVFIPAGTTAAMTLPDGTTQPLSVASIRATEYTVGTRGPLAMPAALPPQSGYTYCVELSADEAVSAGADRVTFSTPLPVYVENFLGFPVGGAVPVGYYDRAKGVWVPSKNGRVIKLLATDGGLATIDSNGDAAPDDDATLAALGLTLDERQRLAALYSAGTTLWRFTVTHFTPWDANWPVGPPADAIAPAAPAPVVDRPCPYPDHRCGSIIDCQNQALGESVAVQGTPFTLNYRSDRLKGRTSLRTVKVQATGATLPASVRAVKVEVRVAGKTVATSLPPALNQTAQVVWDGTDAYGRDVEGARNAVVAVGYEYDLQYKQPADFQTAFNAFPTSPLSVNTARTRLTIWQEQNVTIGGWDNRAIGLGGWSLSVHHVYDPLQGVLYYGDGERRFTSLSGDRVITTLAGTGTPGFSGDGGDATKAMLNGPADVAVGPDGSVYIADASNGRVRKVAKDGIITTIAGGGTLLTNDIPATQVRLFDPEGIAVASDGTLYIAEASGQRIRKVTPSGIISTIAGTGTSGFAGDGGPATAARLNTPYGVAIAPDGSVYIADQFNFRVRRVTSDGTITTVAGNGLAGNFGDVGDGGPATSAKLYYPQKVQIAPDGTIYIIGNVTAGRIRRITPDGIITTIAGTGSYTGSTTDGVAAKSYVLDYPTDLALDRDSSIYLLEPNYRKLLRVSTDGLITTVAGGGTSATALGDNGPAMLAKITSASGAAVAPDGTVYITETFGSARVRKITRALPGLASGETFVPAEDGSVLYVFDQNLRHIRTVDALTGAALYRFAYTPEGYLASITDVDNRVTTIERSGATPTAIVSPNGERTTLTVGSGGMLTSVVDAAGEQKFTYEGDGLLKTYADRKQQVHTFTWDADGRLTKDEDPAGGFTALTRTENGADYTVTVSTATGTQAPLKVFTLSSGDTRQVSSDTAGLDTAKTKGRDFSTTTLIPDGTKLVTKMGPDPRFGMQAPVPSQTTVTMPSGLTSTLTFTRTATLGATENALNLASMSETIAISGRTYRNDFDGRTLQFTRVTPAGRRAVLTVDTAGRTTSEKIANLTPTSFSYDARGRMTGAQQGTRTMTLAYDDRDRLAALTDTLQRTTHFVYDDSGRLTQQILPDQRVIGFSYDANGNVRSVTPPSHAAHAFSVTPVDYLDTYTPPSVESGAGVIRYTWNADRLPLTITRADGETLAFGYMPATHRLATLTSPLGVHQFTYDAQGRLASITAPDGGSVGYGYDGALLTSMTSAGAVATQVTFAYDSSFRLKTDTVAGSSISYSYDADSFVTQAGALALTRDASNGLPTTTTLGSITDVSAYNDFGEELSYVASAGGSEIYSENLVRDGAGRIVERTDSLYGSPVKTTFEYDAIGRLAAVTRAATAVATYEYDPNGNRVAKSSPERVETATYDAQDRLLAYAGTTYTYTGNGDLHTLTNVAGTTTYDYDVFGSLRRVTLPGGTVIEYLIDAQNRRIGKKVNGTVVRKWIYADELRIAAELDGNGALICRFVYASRANVPDYMVRGGITYRIISDHLGSPRVVVDASNGSVAQIIEYDEFGNELSNSNPGLQPFGFAGGLYDRDTRLLRFGARDYDPETGRWTAKDPIGFFGGDANLYAYAFSDPVNLIDPSGLDSVTQDPTVREYFYDLWKAANYGHDNRERAGWITSDPVTQKYGCKRWPWSASYAQETWTGPKPANTIALAHTHPDSKDPKPSRGGTKNDPHDEYTAKNTAKVPIYTISRKGIWKVDTQGNITQEEDGTWFQNIKEKTCTPCGK